MQPIPWLDRENCLRNSLFITWTLICGLLGFLIFNLWNFQPEAVDAAALRIEFDADSVVTLASLLFGIVAMVLSVLVPQLVVRTTMDSLLAKPAFQRRASDPATEQSLLQAFQMSHILKCAILEGAAFVNLIAFTYDGKVLCLFLAILLMGRIFTSIPSASRLNAWMERRETQLSRASSY